MFDETEKVIDITIHYYDDTYVKVEADTSIKMEISDYFCFEVEGAKFHPKVRGGIWDGLIRLFSPRTNLLPAGLSPNLVAWASKNGYFVKDNTVIHDNVDLIELQTWLDSLRIFDGEKQITPHWYQSDAVKHVLRTLRSLVLLPTSAGKSLIIGLLSKWFFHKKNKGKVLILVPTIALVKQMKDDLINYRLFSDKDILCIKGGTERDADSCVYVSTWQTAKNQPKKWFDQFNMLITDEVHLALGTNLAKINQQMTECKYKIGLTGTLKDSKTPVMQLIGLYGQVFKPTNTAELMKDGQVTEIDIRAVLFKYPKVDLKKLGKLSYPDEIKWLITNPNRNKFICRLAIAEKEMNTIVLFKQLTHGKLLYEQIKERLKDTSRKVYYIAGEVKGSDRDALRDIIENSKGAVIVASFGTMSTGVSIKNLHRAICAHPVKSKIINLQSIGRILRKHITKSKALWYDLIDDLRYRSRKNFAYDHGVHRLRLYSRENFNYKMVQVDL